MVNLLKNEKSPYLKQHENNPVNWMPWNKQTLKKIGFFSTFAKLSASLFHGIQFTGLFSCCLRYGLFSFLSRLTKA